MKYLILLMLVLYPNAWAIMPASPQAVREASAIQGDQKTHDALLGLMVPLLASLLVDAQDCFILTILSLIVMLSP